VSTLQPLGTPIKIAPCGHLSVRMYLKDSRMDKPIFIEVNTGELCKQIPCHFKFNLDRTVVMATLRKRINVFLRLSQCDCNIIYLGYHGYCGGNPP
jgi:hypothetical protein